MAELRLSETDTFVAAVGGGWHPKCPTCGEEIAVKWEIGSVVCLHCGEKIDVILLEQSLG